MAGGGIFRQDQVRFAIKEEAVDGTAPATIDDNVGIITGGITLPDVEYEWDKFYGVGREGRARRDIHKGNQSFSGSIAQIYVLFNESRSILERVLGELSRDNVPLTGSNPGEITDVTATTMDDSGENFEVTHVVKDGTFAVFSGISVGYIENETGTGNNTVTVFPTSGRTGTRGWNGPQPAIGDEYEIRKDVSVGTAAGDKFLVGTQRLQPMTWAVQHRNSANHGGGSVGSNLTVNYLGGKVNRATISARQGEKLILSLDEVLFRDLRHDSPLPSTSVAKYSAGTVVPSAVHPIEEPLVFSQGTIALFELGTTFARIRDFSLAVNNNVTEERYISTITIEGSPVISQVPFELIEGNREVTLELTAVMESREYWEHLMREGQNDALNAKTGFDILLKFQANEAGTENFYIQGPAHLNPVIINDNTLPINTSNAQSATNNVGCVFMSAPHEVPGEGEPLIEVRMVVDVPHLVMWWEDN